MGFETGFTLSFLLGLLAIGALTHLMFSWAFLFQLLFPWLFKKWNMDNMNEKRETPLFNLGVPRDMRESIEAILLPLEEADASKLPPRMDKTFRRQMEHQIQLLRSSGLRREFRFTDVDTLGSFKKWNDFGRDWREAMMDAVILERFLDWNGNVVAQVYHNSTRTVIRQSRHIRHDDRKEKDAGKKKEFYGNVSISCPSCGANVELNSQEVHCPYCGALLQHSFYDWQTESFDIYDTMSLTTQLILALVIPFLLIFIVCGLAFSLISSGVWGLAVGILGTISIPVLYYLVTSKKQKFFSGKIVRYSESDLRRNINDALWAEEEDRDSFPSLLTFAVSNPILTWVKNTDKTTTVRLKTNISRVYLKANGKPDIKKETCRMQVSRARYPQRRKNKGAIFQEKSCPSCGANFVPDENNCCSYCGFGLHVNNAKWKILKKS